MTRAMCILALLVIVAAAVGGWNWMEVFDA